MDDQILEYLTELARSHSDRTIRGRQGDLDRFAEWLDDKKPTEDVLAEYVKDLTRKYAATTARRHIDSLSGFFRWRIQTGRSKSDPTRDIERPIPSKSSMRPQRSIHRDLADQIKGTDAESLRDRAIIVVMAKTKAVGHDMESMRVDDVRKSGEKVIVKVRDDEHELSKRDSAIVTRYLKARKVLLKEHRNGHDHGFLWLALARSNFLERISFGWFYGIVKKAKKAADAA